MYIKLLKLTYVSQISLQKRFIKERSIYYFLKTTSLKIILQNKNHNHHEEIIQYNIIIMNITQYKIIT